MPRQPLSDLSRNTILSHAGDVTSAKHFYQQGDEHTPDHSGRQSSPSLLTRSNQSVSFISAPGNDAGSRESAEMHDWPDNHSWSTEVYDPQQVGSASREPRMHQFSPDSSGGSYSNQSVNTSRSIAVTQRFSPSGATSGDCASISPTQTPVRTPLAYSAITPEFDLPAVITVTFGGKHVDLNSEQVEVVLTKCQQLQLAVEKSQAESAAANAHVRELEQQSSTMVEVRLELANSEARGEELRQDLSQLEISSNQVSSELTQMAAEHASHQHQHARLAHELVIAGKAVMAAEQRTAGIPPGCDPMLTEQCCLLLCHSSR